MHILVRIVKKDGRDRSGCKKENTSSGSVESEKAFHLIGSVKLRWVRFGGKWMMGCLHEKRRRWVREVGRMAERMVVYSYLISSWVREAGR